MIIPEFMRFYSLPISEVLNMYSVSFFSLTNSMYRIKAIEQLEQIQVQNADPELVEGLKKQANGLHGIIREVRNVKNAQSKRR